MCLSQTISKAILSPLFLGIGTRRHVAARCAALAARELLQRALRPAGGGVEAFFGQEPPGALASQHPRLSQSVYTLIPALVRKTPASILGSKRLILLDIILLDIRRFASSCTSAERVPTGPWSCH